MDNKKQRLAGGAGGIASSANPSGVGGLGSGIATPQPKMYNQANFNPLALKGNFVAGIGNTKPSMPSLGEGQAYVDKSVNNSMQPMINNVNNIANIMKEQMSANNQYRDNVSSTLYNQEGSLGAFIDKEMSKKFIRQQLVGHLLGARGDVDKGLVGLSGQGYEASSNFGNTLANMSNNLNQSKDNLTNSAANSLANFRNTLAAQEADKNATALGSAKLEQKEQQFNSSLQKDILKIGLDAQQEKDKESRLSQEFLTRLNYDSLNSVLSKSGIPGQPTLNSDTQRIGALEAMTGKLPSHQEMLTVSPAYSKAFSSDRKKLSSNIGALLDQGAVGTRGISTILQTMQEANPDLFTSPTKKKR